MAFPFSTEGEVVIGIDAPSKAQRVVDGVEHWLLQAGARDLRRDGNRISFQGVSPFSPANLLSLLRGVDGSSIKFRDSAGQVVLGYRISFSALQFALIIAFAFPIAAAIGAPSILLSLALLPVFPAVFYLRSLTKGAEFRNALQLAATRGLADGAARELAELRAR